MQVVRGEATPAPLVLQLVEGVLRICPVSVELPQAQNLVAGVGYQYRIFVTGDPLTVALVRFDKAQELGTLSILRRSNYPLVIYPLLHL